jgi:hypothetical protein
MLGDSCVQNSAAAHVGEHGFARMQTPYAVAGAFGCGGPAATHARLPVQWLWALQVSTHVLVTHASEAHSAPEVQPEPTTPAPGDVHVPSRQRWPVGHCASIEQTGASSQRDAGEHTSPAPQVPPADPQVSPHAVASSQTHWLA